MTCSTTDLGERKLDAPDLSLVAETIFTNSLQFRVSEEMASVSGILLSLLETRLIGDMRMSTLNLSGTHRRADSYGRRGTYKKD